MKCFNTNNTPAGGDIGRARTSLIKKNIVWSLGIKGWSGIIQLLLVPLSLKCLTQYEYGIWLTLNSILLMVDTIDVGLGNGLRNKLAEALALDDKPLARKYVSACVAMLLLIITPIVLIANGLVAALDIHQILNVSPEIVPNLKLIVITATSFLGCSFILKFIGNVYLGLQLPAVNNLLVVLGQTLSLLLIFILFQLGCSDLLTVVVAYTASPLLVYAAMYPITFHMKYPHLRPSLRHVDSAAVKELFQTGTSFFFIQVFGLLLFMSSNLIIQKFLTPEAVTPYQIANRYFTILFMIFSIIIAPVWSATTDAYTRKDWDWIHRAIRKTWVLLAVLLAVVCVMLLGSGLFYHLWVGDKVRIPLLLSVLMAVYVYLQVTSNAFSYFLLGIGKTRLMALTGLAELIVFLPLQIIACKAYGTNGLITVLILSMVVTALINFIQLKKIVSNTATGIWDK